MSCGRCVEPRRYHIASQFNYAVRERITWVSFRWLHRLNSTQFDRIVWNLKTGQVVNSVFIYPATPAGSVHSSRFTTLQNRTGVELFENSRQSINPWTSKGNSSGGQASLTTRRNVYMRLIFFYCINRSEPSPIEPTTFWGFNID